MFDFGFEFNFDFDSLFELIYTLVWVAYVYVGTSLGGQRMAEKVGMEKPWLFWIPGANLYALGRLADIQASRQEGKTTHFRRKILIWAIIPTVITVLWGVTLAFWVFAAVANGMLDEAGALKTLDGVGDAAVLGLSCLLLLGFIALFTAYIMFLVIYYKSLYRIYKLYAPDGASGLLVLSIFVGAAIPAIFLVLSCKEPVPSMDQSPDWDAPFYTL